MKQLRMAKVVCTIGPASADPNIIRALIRNGMNVARLNFSHGTHESHRQIIHTIREIQKEMNVHIGILQDLCGPKIRLGTLPETGVTLTTGEEITLCSGCSVYEEDGVLPVAYNDIHIDVNAGETILLADGAMELEILRVDGDKVVCRVINGGVAYSRKGVNLPMSRLSISAFSAKDKADLMMGLEEGIDFVALSFVRTADDLAEISEIIKNSKTQPKLIAKIEKPQAVSNIFKILECADGVMVARGDLGVEVPLEKVPIIQKDVIRSARDMGKIVITATQMLTSMVSSPSPTRGETSDVANAVLDGTDAIMLSEETASGNYPVQACAMLGRIAAATEPYLQNQLSRRSSSSINAATNVSLAVGRSAGWLAADIDAAAIVAYTRSGFTAYAVSQFRPNCPIIALAPNETVCRQLALCWGTTALVTKLFDDTDDMFVEAKKIAAETGFARKGDRIILTAGVPMGKAGSTTLIRVLEL